MICIRSRPAGLLFFWYCAVLPESMTQDSYSDLIVCLTKETPKYICLCFIDISNRLQLDSNSNCPAGPLCISCKKQRSIATFFQPYLIRKISAETSTMKLMIKHFAMDARVCEQNLRVNCPKQRSSLRHLCSFPPPPPPPPPPPA